MSFQKYQQKIENFIKDNHFKKIVLGYSGGADSQFLYQCLKNINIEKIVIHINHGISKNAQKWESFCEEQANIDNISFKSFKLDFSNITGNVEEKARNERYHIFSKFLNSESLLLTAHHLDDQAETVLMRLFRGTGLDGLEGIKEFSIKNDMNIYRPLLDITKEEIKNVLVNNKISWVEDESNSKSDYDRNYIRNEIMPMIKKRWLKANVNIAKAANHCKENNKVFKEIQKNNFDTCKIDNNKIDLNKIKNYNNNEIKNIIRELFKRNKIEAPSQKVLESILNTLIFSNSNGFIEHKKFHCKKFNHIIYLWDSKESLNFKNKNLIKNYKILFLNDIKNSMKIKINNCNKNLSKVLNEYKIEKWLRKELPIIVENNNILNIGDLIYSDEFKSSCFEYENLEKFHHKSKM